jgi:hypothetical protein
LTAAVGLHPPRPETVTNGFGEIRGDKDNFIQKSLLLAQHGNYCRLNQAGKFRGSLGFESNYDVTSKHTYTFGLELLGSDDLVNSREA